MKLNISAVAFEDIEEIYMYSYQNFGADRTESYISALQLKMQSLLQNPESGEACTIIKEGLRRLLSESHSIFYTVEKDNIYIVRILHQSKDVLRVL